jgi:chromosome segregation ATPase
MNEEPTTVTYSLAEILSRLDQKMDRLDQKIDRLDQKMDNIETKLESKIDDLETKLGGRIDNVETKLNQQSEEIASIKATLQAQQKSVDKIPDLAERVGELKNWRQFVIITITATLSGFIGWLVRGGNFKP